MDNDLSMQGASAFITSIAETITRMDIEYPEQNLRATFEDYLGRSLLQMYQNRQILELDDRSLQHRRVLHAMLRNTLDHPSLVAMAKSWKRPAD